MAQYLPHGECDLRTLLSLSLVSFLLSLFQIFSNSNHGFSWRRSECWGHMHPLGLLRISWPPGSLVPGVHHLYGHVTGPLGMIAIIRVSPNLQTPMYYFLSQLSLIDLCYSPTVTPKLLKNFVVEDRTISFIRCIMQFFILWLFAVAETFMLAVMAYDRFVTVCKPLICTVVMSPKLCASLVARPYPWGIVAPMMLTFFLLALSFCGSNIINNCLWALCHCVCLLLWSLHQPSALFCHRHI